MPMSSTSLNQVRVTWTGFPGGPGISTFYYEGNAVPPVAALRAFFNTMAAFIPSSVTIQVPAAGDGIDSGDGVLDGSWSVGTPPAAVVGAATGTVTAAQGFQILWQTGEVADGRNIKGRTYFVPVVAAVLGADGLVTPGTVTGAASAITTLLAATPQMRIWHRPKKGPKPAGGGPAPIVRPGSHGPVISGALQRKVVVLTSRRD